jgi:competence protein ComGC
MVLLTVALILPRSFVLRWFEARKRAMFTLIGAWFVVLAVISLLVLLGVLH